MKSNPSLDDLQLFQQIVQYAGISATAQATGVPAATLSRRLKRLEHAVGGRLLERNAHQFALTELGDGYYQRCAPLLAELQSVRQQLSDAHTHLRGRLRITAPVGIAQHWLGQCFNDFMRHYPGIELEVLLSNQIENLVEQHLDAAFRVGELRDSSWVARLVWQSHGQLCAAPAYLQQAGSPAHPQALHQHALIASYPVHEWVLEHAHTHESYRFNPQTRMRVNDVQLALDAARAGLGITLLPGYFRRPDDGLQRVLPDWEGDRRPLYLCYRDRSAMAARLQAFIDFVMHWVAARDISGHLGNAGEAR